MVVAVSRALVMEPRMKFARIPTFNSLRASSSDELLPKDQGKVHAPFEDISIFKDGALQ